MVSRRPVEASSGLAMKSTAPRAKCFEGRVGAFFRMRAEENDGKRSAAHDQAQGLHAVHARHFEIEGDDVGLELFDFFQGEGAVHRGANDFDGGIAREDRGNQLPHERGVIDYEDTDAFAHAIAPSGVARERRDKTAGTFRIRTTVPSPRIDAPLTRSLANDVSGQGLDDELFFADES